MAICRFFQQGNCRFGANCKNEHPGATNNRFQNANPFSPLLANANNNNRGGGGGGFSSGANATETRYGLSKESIHTDLTTERPSWILSSYGPGRGAPEQLFGGNPMEQSFEEMRLFYLMGEATGNPQGALAEIGTLYNNARMQIDNAANNIDDAMRYILSAENKHPNRIDVCKSNSIPSTGEFAIGKRPVGYQLAQPASGNVFLSVAAPSTGIFGSPSTLGQNANVVGGAATGGSVWGQPQASSKFGAPSTIGQNIGGQFGQPSTLGATPNPFLGAAAAANPFGSNTAPAPSIFTPTTNVSGGQSATMTNPWAPQEPSVPEVSMTSAPPTTSFGVQTTAPTPNPFANATSAINGGSQAPTAPNPFSLPAAGTALGNAPPAIIGDSQAPIALNPFSRPEAGADSGTAIQEPAEPASGVSTGPYAPNASRQHPPLSSYATRAPNGVVVRWKGQPVAPKKIGDGPMLPGVNGINGKWNKIWFPQGPPVYNNDTEPDRPYTEAESAAWKRFIQTGTLELGNVPEAPPMRECCKWDF